MTVTLAANVTETTSFRCTVTVGDEDDQASDTKLVYAQKIRVGYSKDNNDGGDYITEGDSLTVTIYGDDAYALLTDDSVDARLSKCGIGTADVPITDKSIALPITAPSGDYEVVTVTCNLIFDTGTSATSQVVITSDITTAKNCADGEHFDKTGNVCTACTGNAYLSPADNQYQGCQQCPGGEEGNTAAGDATSTTGNSGCDVCDAGQYATGTGVCTACPAGTYTLSTGSGSCEECEVGTASTAVGRWNTTCDDCQGNTYAPSTGYTQCLTCRGNTANGISCVACNNSANEYFNIGGSGGCATCDGGTYYHSVSNSCVTCGPGTKIDTGGCDDCPVGTHQPAAGQNDCEACDAAHGEYQTETGKSYCNVAAPGHQIGTSVAHETEECPKGTYSTGGMQTCYDCNADLREYTETTGSTFCSICQEQVINDECEASTCDEDSVTLEGVGDENFTFPLTSSGLTATLVCSSDTDADPDEMVTRYCRYDSTTGIGSWDATDSGQCSTMYTAAVEAVAEEISNLDVANTTATEAVTANMQNLTSVGAATMSAKDYNNIADTLEVLSTTLVSAASEDGDSLNVSSDTASNLAETVVSVASAGGTKLESVDQEEKDKMVNCLTTVASLLAVDEPVVTGGVAMVNLNTIDESAVTLPAPLNTAAPVLKMNSVPENAPSVAVFDKTTATAMFPTPSSSESTKNTVSSTSNIDSNVVSLDFQGATELDFDIAISVNTSADGDYGSAILLERSCQYYNEEDRVWLTDGCSTTTGEADEG